jgi:hypothetical protein
MDCKEFIESYGREAAERVALDAGTNYIYFRQLAYGHSRPSPDLAERLVNASGGRLDFETLMRAEAYRQKFGGLTRSAYYAKHGSQRR